MLLDHLLSLKHWGKNEIFRTTAVSGPHPAGPSKKSPWTQGLYQTWAIGSFRPNDNSGTVYTSPVSLMSKYTLECLGLLFKTNVWLTHVLPLTHTF